MPCSPTTWKNGDTATSTSSWRARSPESSCSASRLQIVWVSMTPFGRPVVPLEYRISAMSLVWVHAYLWRRGVIVGQCRECESRPDSSCRSQTSPGRQTCRAAASARSSTSDVRDQVARSRVGQLVLHFARRKERIHRDQRAAGTPDRMRDDGIRGRVEAADGDVSPGRQAARGETPRARVDRPRQLSKGHAGAAFEIDERDLLR